MENINDLPKQKNRVLFKARFMMPSLGKAEKSAAKYLLENPETVSTMKIVEFADTCDISQATIVRLCKRLGYDGFTELKSKLTRELGSSEVGSPLYPEIGDDKDFLSLANQIIQTATQAMQDTLSVLDEESGSRAIEELVKAQKVFVYGLGDSGDVARAARHKFLRLGYESQAPSDVDVQLLTANLLGENDVAIAISHSGKSKPIYNALKKAQEQGATSICLTNAPESPITKVSDIELFTAAGMAPSAENEVIARRVAELSIIDILFVGIISADKEKYFENLRTMAKQLKVNKM